MIEVWWVSCIWIPPQYTNVNQSPQLPPFQTGNLFAFSRSLCWQVGKGEIAGRKGREKDTRPQQLTFADTSEVPSGKQKVLWMYQFYYLMGVQNSLPHTFMHPLISISHFPRFGGFLWFFFSFFFFLAWHRNLFCLA